MQTSHLDINQFADFLADPATKILDIVDHGATRMHVAEFNGQDVFVFSSYDSNATVVYTDAVFDDESGGSVHDHARAIRDNA